MVAIHPQFITNNAGEKLSVILPLQEFNQLMEELEDLEDLKLYDDAQKGKKEFIPIDDAFKMIEENRKKNGL